MGLGHFLLEVGYIDEAQHVLAKAEPFLETLDADASSRFRHWQDLCHIHTNIYDRLMQVGKEQEAHVRVLLFKRPPKPLRP
jgi:hypothetical protein